MQPVTLNAADVSLWVSRLWWPSLRVGGFVLAAPVASETTIPSFVKIILSVSLAFLMSPLVQVPAALSIFSGAGMLAAVQELLIGVAIGMVVQLAFEALTFAGQSISLTMGLGFATLVDPQRGANTTGARPAVHDFRRAHLSGHQRPSDAARRPGRELSDPADRLPHIDGNFLLSVVLWGAHVFETGLLIALPAVIALVIVNLALGVVTRAAPQLNLFGIGFTITLLCGFFVLIAGLDGIMSGISSLINSALAAAGEIRRRARRGSPLMAKKPKRAANAPKSLRNDACRRRASAARCRVRAN